MPYTPVNEAQDGLEPNGSTETALLAMEAHLRGGRGAAVVTSGVPKLDGQENLLQALGMQSGVDINTYGDLRNVSGQANIETILDVIKSIAVNQNIKHVVVDVPGLSPGERSYLDGTSGVELEYV